MQIHSRIYEHNKYGASAHINNCTLIVCCTCVIGLVARGHAHMTEKAKKKKQIVGNLQAKLVKPKTYFTFFFRCIIQFSK